MQAAIAVPKERSTEVLTAFGGAQRVMRSPVPSREIYA